MVRKHRIQSIILLAVVMLSGQIGLAAVDTWQLEQGQDWKPIQAKDEDKYLLVVARTEKLVSTGQTKALSKEWGKLKKLFSEIAEQDLDIFIGSELLFSKGKYIKAVRSYDKFLDKDYHESKLYDAALHRQFHIAEAFLAGRKKTVLGVFKMKGYAEGVKIMESISERAGNRPIAIRAALAVATSYEERKMFNEAYLKWSEISWQLSNIRLAEWNTGPITKQALLRMAQCKHASYKGPKYDASGLNSAKSYYEQFKVQYPEDAKELGVDKKLAQIDEQLAYKQFSIGQYYQKTGYRLSANLYYDMVIQNWPESGPTELAKEMRAKNLSSKEIKK
ncbi:MAG: hypothetical protein ACETVZ_07725 [Phycisphaerae bacterium]